MERGRPKKSEIHLSDQEHADLQVLARSRSLPHSVVRRGLASQETGISKSTVQRYLHLFGVQPHRSKSFKLSTDPSFVEKVRDIVGLYLNPPDKALVLCVDEKSQIQALERSQPAIPAGMGDIVLNQTPCAPLRCFSQARSEQKSSHCPFAPAAPHVRRPCLPGCATDRGCAPACH